MKSWIAVLLLLTLPLATLTAAENGGLSVDVQKVSLERHDGQPRGGMGTMTIDRKMALRINIQNVSMKELPATTLKYVMVIQRWGLETANYERSQGELQLPKVPPSTTSQVSAGEVTIGGHMHGTSDRHVDRIAGWKVTIVRDGKNLDFFSSPSFESLNQKVKK
ncbi:MAG: hypothetical protein NTZ46_01890 [Verrucomicrobia bacterium]|nr:hypothetical protein [Verrucomicrobiota bacterium]